MSFTYACEMDILLAVIFCSSRVEMHTLPANHYFSTQERGRQNHTARDQVPLQLMEEVDGKAASAISLLSALFKAPPSRSKVFRRKNVQIAADSGSPSF